MSALQQYHSFFWQMLRCPCYGTRGTVARVQDVEHAAHPQTIRGPEGHPRMEKYSQFNDPFTGINPFVNPVRRDMRLVDLVVSLLRLPLLLLLYLDINVISALISIKCKPARVRGLVACNSSSVFDTYVVKAVLGNVPCFHLAHIGFVNMKGEPVSALPATSVVFVEGCSSNNRSILRFVRHVPVDYVLGLRYNPECIYMHGSYIRFLLGFLAAGNTVNVGIKQTKNAGDLLEITGLKQVGLSLEDKERFLRVCR